MATASDEEKKGRPSICSPAIYDVDTRRFVRFRLKPADRFADRMDLYTRCLRS